MGRPKKEEVIKPVSVTVQPQASNPSRVMPAPSTVYTPNNDVVLVQNKAGVKRTMNRKQAELLGNAVTILK